MTLKKIIRDTYYNVIARFSARGLERRLKDQLLNDIDTFIKHHCAKMSLNSSYRNKLTQSINVSLAHISGLIPQIPGPVTLNPKHWANDPVMHAFFLKPEAITALIQSSKRLKPILENNNNIEAFALLTATMNEKTILTTEKNGEIIRRDVPRKAVYFENHELLAPAKSLNESQYKIKYLSLSSMCRQPFQETADLQSWKKDLEEQQSRIEFKLNTAEAGEELEETTQLLADIRRKIKSINKQVNVTEEHLTRITDVFDHPENHLSLTIASLKLDQLGIRLPDNSKERADEFSIAEFQFGQPPKKAAIWVRIETKIIT